MPKEDPEETEERFSPCEFFGGFDDTEPGVFAIRCKLGGGTKIIKDPDHCMEKCGDYRPTMPQRDAKEVVGEIENLTGKKTEEWTPEEVSKVMEVKQRKKHRGGNGKVK